MGSLPGACKDCARKAEPGSEYCCVACRDYNIHTAACNAKTWPEWDGAQYLDDPNAPEKILDRLQNVLALCNVVHKELMKISASGERFVPNFRDRTEHAIGHLHYDILHVESIIRKLIKD